MTPPDPSTHLRYGLFWLVPRGPDAWDFLTSEVAATDGGSLDGDLLDPLFEELWPVLRLLDEDLADQSFDEFPRGLVAIAPDGSAELRIDPCLNLPRLIGDLARAFDLDLDRTRVRTDRHLLHHSPPPWVDDDHPLWL